MSQWKEKVAVITGAGSGIGAALAQQCAKQAMHIVAADVDADGLAALERPFNKNHSQPLSVLITLMYEMSTRLRHLQNLALIISRK